MNQSVDIYTLAGLTPIVAVDTTYPATSYELLSFPGSDPPQYYVQPRVVNAPVHQADPYLGQFRLHSNTYAISQELITAGSDYYDSSLAEGSICYYRWI
jgi:hypothetical protein